MQIEFVIVFVTVLVLLLDHWLIAILIQVIYQGSARFVIISSVDDASWTVHVGLTGDEGRWWRGRWVEKDVKKQFVSIRGMLAPGMALRPYGTRSLQGSGVSSFLLESAVEKMAATPRPKALFGAAEEEELGRNAAALSL